MFARAMARIAHRAESTAAGSLRAEACCRRFFRRENQPPEGAARGHRPAAAREAAAGRKCHDNVLQAGPVLPAAELRKGSAP